MKYLAFGFYISFLLALMILFCESLANAETIVKEFINYLLEEN